MEIGSSGMSRWRCEGAVDRSYIVGAMEEEYQCRCSCFCFIVDEHRHGGDWKGWSRIVEFDIGCRQKKEMSSVATWDMRGEEGWVQCVAAWVIGGFLQF